MRLHLCILFVGACGSPAVTTHPPAEPEPEPVEVPAEESPPATDSATTSTGGEDTGTVPDTGLSCLDLAEMVRNLFQQRCAACHSRNSPQYAGFAHVLDPGYLVDEGWVVPGQPDESVVLSVIVSGSMPAAGGPVGQDGQRAVEEWITCGAEPWGP